MSCGATILFHRSSDLPEGGTSLAAPLWAGFMALVNQQAAANGQPPIGFVNPALYAIGKKHQLPVLLSRHHHRQQHEQLQSNQIQRDCRL